MASADRAQLIAELLLDDKFTKPLNRIDKRLGAFSGAVNRNVGRGIDNAVSAVARGVVTVGKSVATAAIDWEDAFQGVVKTVEATPQEFDKIAQSIRNMATEMPVTAVELAAIAEAGGAMGIAAGDIDKFTKQVAILASTTNLSSEDAATGLGQLQNVIGLTGDEFDDFADTLVYLGNKGASTESTILEIARRAGAVGSSFGISKDQILGWSAAAANLGMEADQAGGSLQGLITKLQPAIFSGNKTIREVFGRSGKDIRRIFEKDASRGLELFVRKLRKMPKEARFEAIEKLFGRDRGIRRLITGLIGDVDGLTNTLDDAADGWFKTNAAQEEFDKRNKTVRSAITRMRNGLYEAAITVGEGFVPALGRAADKLSDFLKLPENRQALKDLGADIGKMIDGVDWDSLLSNARSLMGALEKAGGFARGLWDAFNSLDSDTKAMLISLGGLNKLTGGAPIKIAVDFAKEGLGRLFERGGSPANPMWVQMAGAGPGGLPIPGGGKVPIGPGVIKPAIGAGVVFPLAEFHQQTKADLRSAGLLQDIKNKLPGKGQLPGAPGGGPHSGHTGTMQGWADGRDAWSKPIRELQASAVSAMGDVKTSTDDVAKIGRQGVIAEDRTRGATELAGSKTSMSAAMAGMLVSGTSIGNTGRIVGAIYGAQDIVNVNVQTYVSATGVTRSQTTTSRTSRTSSRTSDRPAGTIGGP